MKKIILCVAIFLSAAMLKNAEAQLRVNVNFNIGSQPVWGPAGYDYAEYYYLPDIQTYYYVPRHQFVYLSGGRWIFSASLPYRYRSYDLYSGYKVVVNEPNAYMHFDDHRSRYADYRNHRGTQVIIRNSNDPKYYVVKGHPHNKYKSNNGRGRGNNKH